MGQDYDRAVATIERALSHNPCCIWALTSGALVYAMGGEAARARTFADRSLRLTPFDPIARGVHYVRSFAALIEGRPDEAVSEAVAAVHLHPHFGGLHAVHAIALVLAGRTEEGRAVARKALEAFPAYNQGWIGHMVRDPALTKTLQRGGIARGAAGIEARMTETRKLAAILFADVASWRMASVAPTPGYRRLPPRQR